MNRDPKRGAADRDPAKVAHRWAERHGIRPTCEAAKSLHDKYGGGPITPEEFDNIPQRYKSAKAIVKRKASVQAALIEQQAAMVEANPNLMQGFVNMQAINRLTGHTKKGAKYDG